MDNNMNCKICNNQSYFFANGKILQKHLIAYYQCGQCGFIQTEEPYWLTEAYSEAINESDVGIVSRNISYARLAKIIITAFFDSSGRFIDYAGGYGLFVRLMRDYGFDFYHFDKYCENLFAKGFDLDESRNVSFEVLTAFEVFEHFIDPVAELDELLKLSSNVLFSTELVPPSNPKPEEWWYYGLEHGQHISFYNIKSLQCLARSKKLFFHTNRRNLHLFTKKKISNLLFRLICSGSTSKILDTFIRRKSLLASDYESITGISLI